EDAAQAIGARRKIDGQWRMAGELGWATGYSFFPSKNLGAWGDGGMMVTSDDALAERLRKLRLHGGAKQYHHDEVGTNSRLDSMQAAVLLAKLPYLAAWSERRREHAATYSNALADVSEVRTPVVDAAPRPAPTPPTRTAGSATRARSAPAWTRATLRARWRGRAPPARAGALIARPADIPPRPRPSPRPAGRPSPGRASRNPGRA